MSSAADLLDKLNQMAETMLSDAQKDGVTLPNRIDVFKIVSQHYATVAKVKGGGREPPGETTPTMGELRDRVAQTGEADDE